MTGPLEGAFENGVVIGCMAGGSGLSEIELVWLIVWNIADGEWDRIGLGQDDRCKLLLELFVQLHGDPLNAARESRTRLQQRLMALRRGSFEEIQTGVPVQPARPTQYGNSPVRVAGRRRGGIWASL